MVLIIKEKLIPLGQVKKTILGYCETQKEGVKYVDTLQDRLSRKELNFTNFNIVKIKRLGLK